MPRGKTHSPAVGDPGRDRSGRDRSLRFGLIDRWLLRLVAAPLVGGAGVTLLAFLLERALRLMTELAASNARGAYLLQLLASLTPYYLGLVLPAAFFLALFLLFARLSDGSEIDALLAAGVSMDRIAAPLVALGCALGLLSLFLSGWAAPQGRYAYRSILHAAQTGGWNGEVPGGTFASPGRDAVMTADAADATGRRLRRVWIRQRVDGEERVTTAATARLLPGAVAGQERLALSDGQQVRHDASGRPDVLAFRSLELDLPTPALDRTPRQRGGDARELTLPELAGAQAPGVPRRLRAAEMWDRVARALALPLLPLLAAPLSLAAKRGGRVLSGVAAAAVLFGFQHLLGVGVALGGRGKLPVALGVGGPLTLFAALSAWTWVSGRRRPGETPLSRAVESAAALAGPLRPRPASAAVSGAAT